MHKYIINEVEVNYLCSNVFASVMVYQCPCVTLHKGIIAEGGGHLKVVLNK